MTRAILILLLAMAAGVWAGGAPATAADAPTEHRIQPGDTLEVGRWDDEVESVLEVVVSPEGNIAYPQAGAVAVKDLTLEEAKKQLVQRLREAHIRRPEITIALKAPASKATETPAPVRPSVYVVGAVNRPGTFDLVEEMRVRDVLGLAGGLAQDADGARATLHSTKNGVSPVDIDKLMEGDAAMNLAIAGGDMLVVPKRANKEEAKITVFILGQVQRAGSVVMPADSRVTDLAMASGGFQPGADLKRTTISRGKATIPVDLEALLRRGDLSANLPLQDGDVVVVPEIPRCKVTLVGEFMKPGVHALPEGAKVTDAWAAGGGTTPNGDPQLMVLRRAGTDTVVDMNEILTRGRFEADQPVQEGDVLVIPRGTQIYVYSGVQKPGPVVIRKGTRVIDVLMLAGGALPNANLAKAGVVRDGKETTEIFQINIKEAAEKGGKDRNFQFAENDVLVIPMRGERFGWRTILTGLSAVSLVMNPLSYILR